MAAKAMRRAGTERPRFYAGQTVRPDDLNLAVDYARERQRRHNRALHGWGVVYGAGVAPVPDPKTGRATRVRVSPGFILGPRGDEIEIPAELTFDPAKGPTTADPMLTEVPVDLSELKPKAVYYLAVKYREVPAGAVPAAPRACGCADPACQATRCRDCYEFRLLADPPEDNTPPPFPPTAPPAKLPAAPAAPASEWVVLAGIQYENGAIVGVDPVSYRRTVVSASALWWRPEVAATKAEVVSDVAGLARRAVTLKVTGANLYPGAGGVTIEKGDIDAAVESFAPDYATQGEVLTVRVGCATGTAADRKLSITVGGRPLPPLVVKF